MTKTTNQVTACPECDSGNLYVQGSTVECLTCGWKHTATAPKRTRTSKPKTAKQVEDNIVEVAQEILAGDTTNLETLQDVIMHTVSTMEVSDPCGLLPSVAEQLQAAVTPAKPKAERKAKVPTTAYVLTAKGSMFTPDPKRSRVKGSKNQETWLTVKALFNTEPVVSHAAIVAAIPTHTDFVGYAVRSGWLRLGQ